MSKNVLSRLNLRKAAEAAESAATTKSSKPTKAAKAPKKTKPTEATQAAETTQADKADPEAPKAAKVRGRKGKHGMPVYQVWTQVFECNGLAAEGKPNVFEWTTPKTDDEIAKFILEEFDGRCEEAKKPGRVSGVRSLYNRGVINKQTGPPARLVGRFERTPEGKLQEVVTARRVVAVAG